jgi:pSer/pThr/pTyr-binding forkhead associated (FHA) protein
MSLRFVVIAREGSYAGAWMDKTLEANPVVIGRSDDADLLLEDPSVDLAHVRVEEQSGTWTLTVLTDLGTWLNDRKVPRDHSIPIRAGHKISLGVYQLLFLADDCEGQLLGRGQAARELISRLLSDARTPFLEILNGPNKGVRMEVGALGLSIGRADDCGLVLDDSRVSRKHAFVYLKNSLVWIKDDNSANGCLANGTKVHEPTVLGQGACVQIGRMRMQVCYPEISETTGLSAFLKIERKGKGRSNWVFIALGLVLLIALGVAIAI